MLHKRRGTAAQMLFYRDLGAARYFIVDLPREGYRRWKS
jgi:hypothetical protein